MKGELTLLLFTIIAFVLLVGCVADTQSAIPFDATATENNEPLHAGNGTSEPTTSPTENSQPPNTNQTFTYPPELLVYQQYRRVIKISAGQSDTVIVEAVVLSLIQNDVCPYQKESCPIEPYPNDWGVVRVDKIIEYQLASKDTATMEEQSNSATSQSEQITSSNQGDTTSGKPKEKAALQIGQEAQTQFLLSARSAIARTIAAPEADPSGLESDAGEGQAMAQNSNPADSQAFAPLPKNGESFVFTIGVSDTPDEVILPGLAVGTRFRAIVQYDGILYVETYEVIP